MSEPSKPNEIEIKKKGVLLNSDGFLRIEGFSRSFMLEYNKSVLRKLKNITTLKHVMFSSILLVLTNYFVFSWFLNSILLFLIAIFIFLKRTRIKEWEYYFMLNNEENIGLAITLADLGYLAVGSYVFFDFEKNHYFMKEETSFFPSSVISLPDTSEPNKEKRRILSGYSGKQVKISIEAIDDEKNNQVIRRIKVWGKGSNSIFGKLELIQQRRFDSLMIATSWKENRKCFYHNHKINCMKTTGFIEFQNKNHKFNDNEKTNNNCCLSVLDWGRGIWTYNNTWYWSSLSCTLSNGDLLGWNLGYGFSDRSSASENIVFHNGESTKLGEIEFIISDAEGKKKKRKNKFLNEWTIRTVDSDRFVMKFEPSLDRFQDTNFLIVRSSQHQVFGYFSGHIVLDEGKVIEISRVFGFAEEVFNRW